MPKFGGPGRKKQCCVRKQCIHLSARQFSTEYTPAIKVSLTHTCKNVHLSSLWPYSYLFPSQGGKLSCIPLHTNNPDIFLASVSCKQKLVVGDGNCFFRALSYIVYEDESHHQSSHLVQLIQLNANIFLPLVLEGTMENHVSSMLVEGTWATQVELSATAIFFNVQVFSCTPNPQTKNYQWTVFNPVGPKVIYPKEGDLESLKNKYTQP